MAWSKSDWVDVIGASGALQVLAPAANATGSIDCAGTNKYVSLATQVYYAASAAASTLSVAWYGLNPDSSLELADTVSMFEVEIVGVNSASVKQTTQIDVSALDAVQIKTTNNENTDSASVWVACRAGYI